MRRLKNYSLERVRFELPLLTYRDRADQHTVEINAEDKDEIEVFSHEKVTYVLSWNERLRFVGLEAFVGHDKVGEVFVQNRDEIEKTFGKKGLSLTPVTMAKRLLPHINTYSPQPYVPMQSRLQKQQSKTVSFEIHLEDLNEGAKKRYLEFVKGEPAYGPLAIIEIEQEEEGKDKGGGGG